MTYYSMKQIPISERPRERLKQLGANNLSDKELLCIIFGSGTKGFNVGDLSIELLKNYNLSDLKNITINELEKIKGIGEVKAISLIACVELGKRIFLRQEISLTKLSNPKQIWQDSKYLFNNLKQEYFYCLYFNNKQELLERKLLFMGTINNSITHPREIFKEAYKLSASSIVCMHNHPSNDIRPSRADIHFTNNLVKIGKLHGIPIVDHIIVGEDNYYSFYEHNNILDI